MLPATDAMLMIDPPPASSMAGRKARIIRYMARTFRFIEKSKASASQSRMVPWWTKPAPLNSTWMRPIARPRRRRRHR
jgi:hypothetical protein